MAFPAHHVFYFAFRFVFFGFAGGLSILRAAFAAFARR
jgi:hypothetical protein